MRVFFSSVIFCTLLLANTLSYADNSTVHNYQLNNGLALVVKVDKRAPVVLSEIWYKVGSSYEYTGITGISHVLEHMMFKGTPKYPADSFSKLIAENGGQQNAMTTQDYTMYYQELANDKLPLAFKLEADRMQNLSFSDKDFDSELKVVQEERRMRIDNDPLMATYERYNATAFIDNPYRNPVAGWASDLSQITLDDLKQWYSTWYVPNNVTIVVVGNVDPEAVHKLASQYFGGIKPKPLPASKKFTLPTPMGEKNIQVKAPAKLPILYMGYNVPTTPSKPNSYEPYALDVLSTILGGTNSSRLQKDLVRDQRVAGDIAVYYTLYARLPTLFQIAAIPAQGTKSTQLKQAILKEINNLQTKPISEAELKKIKIQIIADRIYLQDSIDSQGMLIGSLATVNLPYSEFDNYQKQIEKLTPAQITAVAKKYLIEDNLTIGVLLPQQISGDKSKTMMPKSALGNQHVN